MVLILFAFHFDGITTSAHIQKDVMDLKLNDSVPAIAFFYEE